MKLDISNISKCQWKNRISSTFFLILFGITILYGQIDSTLSCEEISESAEHVFLEEGLMGIQRLSKILRRRSKNGDPQCIRAYYWMEVGVSYSARNKQDWFIMKLALEKLDSIFQVYPFENSNEKLVNYADLLVRKGHYYYGIGAYDQSKKIFNHIIDTLGQPPPTDGNLSTSANLAFQKLGDIALQKGMLNQAKKHIEYSIQQSIEETRLSGDDPEIETNMSRLGLINMKLDLWQEADTAFKIVNDMWTNWMDTASKEGIQTNTIYFIPDHLNHVKVLLHLKKYKKALNHIDFVNQVKHVDDPYYILTNSLHARVLVKLGLINKADSLIQITSNHIHANSNNLNLEYLYEYHISKIDLFSRSQNLLKSLETIQEFLNHNKHHLSGKKNTTIALRAEALQIELLVKNNYLDSALLKLDTFQKRVLTRLTESMILDDHSYNIAQLTPTIELGLEIIEAHFPSKKSLAFELIELMKSIKLLKDTQGKSSRNKNVSEESLLAYRNSINELRTLELSQHKSNKKEFIENRIYEQERIVESFKQKVFVNSSDSNQPRTNLRDLQKKLHKNTAFMATFEGIENTYLIIIDRKNVIFKKVENSILLPAISSVLSSISNKEKGSSPYTKLYGLLFGEQPLANYVRLIISADKTLNLIPFEALITNGKYLVEDHIISYQPSAKWWLANPSSLGAPNDSVLIIRPDFQETSFLPLVHSKKEVETISQMFQSEIKEGRTATKQSFTNESGVYKILHLSTHAASMENDPSLSFIQFTKLDGQSDNQSRLYFNEVSDLSLNAELAVLSACETGFGKATSGEGLLSLGRNFMVAGCQSIVSTLWPVNDQSSTEIMTSFYGHLKKNFDVPEALQKAKKDFLESRNGGYKHPYYWAGYTVIGESRTNVDPAFYGLNPKWIWAVLIGIGIFLFLKFFRQNANRSLSK